MLQTIQKIFGTWIEYLRSVIIDSDYQRTELIEQNFIFMRSNDKKNTWEKFIKRQLRVHVHNSPIKILLNKLDTIWIGNSARCLQNLDQNCENIFDNLNYL